MANSFSRIISAINNQDAFIIGQYFNINYLTNSKDSLKLLSSDPQIRRLNPQYWTKIFSNLFNTASSSNSKSAFDYYNQAVTHFIDNVTDVEMKIGVLRVISRSLFHFATSGCYSEANRLLSRLRNIVKIISGGHHNLIDSPLLAVINSLASIDLLENNFNLAEKLFDSLGQNFKFDPNLFTKSELASYHFLKGKVDMVYERRDIAYNEFKKSLSYIPLDNDSDRRLVYAHFIPICISFGIVPSKQLIDKYNLYIYTEFSEAVATGNLTLYTQALDKYQNVLIRLGVWEMIVLAKRIVERRLLEIVHSNYEINRFPISSFHKALCLFGDYSYEDSLLIIANLSFDKLVRANIAYKLGLVVFHPEDPFPLPIPEEI